jgi:hypothetical protein
MKNKLNRIKGIALTAVLCWACYEMQAQKATEIYIPLGKSPGVSGKFSLIGKVESVNAKDSTISIRQQGGVKTGRITANTIIYLDKSNLKRPNTKGSLTDIKQGVLVELKYQDNHSGGLIEWLKVQLERQD